MGCGCCTANEKAVSVPAPKAPMKVQPAPVEAVAVPEVSEVVESEASSRYLFLLGVTESKRPHLLQFDPSSTCLKELAMPARLELYNYSSMTCVGPERFLVSGGISADMAEITNKCFLVSPLAGTCEVVPRMHSVRYTHISAYHKEHVYVFGGRQLGDDDEAIISKSERYSLSEDRWEELPPMSIQRCTGFSLLWRDKIYVFGGYTSEFRRSKKIEVFDPLAKSWSLCPFTLHQGLECGSIAATGRPNEFVLFGGNMKYGAVSTVNAFDLSLGTVHTRPKMQQARVLQKSIVHEHSIYVLGGCEDDNVEVCDLQSFKWKDVNARLGKLIPPAALDVFAQSCVTCAVPSGESRPTRVSSEYSDEVVFLFGTDAEPFVLEFNISVPYAVSHPVPLAMRCYSFQGGVSLPDHRCILMGGITDDLDESVKHCYEFDGRTLQARRLPDMLKARYAFSAIYSRGYVYVLGGRNEEEGVEGLTDQCERYDVSRGRWEPIRELPIKCVSSCAFAYKERVYVTGGYQQNQDRNTNIYLYEENKNSWKALPFQMPFGIEASALLWGSEKELLFFGGRVHSGDIDSVWQMVVAGESAGGVIEQGLLMQVGSLGENKSLHKVYHPRHQDFAVVFGGEVEKASFYSLKSHRMEKSDLLSNVFSTFQEQVRHLQDPTMKKYLLLS